MSNPTKPAVTVETGFTSADAQAVVNGVADVAGEVLPLLFPGGTLIAGLAVADVPAILKGIASGIPDVVSAYNAVKAAITGGSSAPVAELAALKTALDAADDAVQQVAGEATP